VDKILQTNIDIPKPLQEFMQAEKQTLPMDNDFQQFKDYLLS
jgi:hypothetical protein